MTGAQFVVVMGVSGCGKSSVAEGVAKGLGGAFLEADRYHSPENVARMSQGIGLTDELRWPWLESVCAAARAEPARPVVIACSALKRAYRDFLRQRLDGVRFVFLDGPREVIAARMQARPGHFAGVSLLDSQIATLEPPGTDEGTIRVSVTLPPAEIIATALAALRTDAHQTA